jgi:glutamate-1-semialdehyde 2,1-aminomutase
MPSPAQRNLTLEAAVAETEARYVAANPKSRAQYEAACRHMPGANTRTVLHYDPFPVTLVKGEGARLQDLDGHGYTDYLGEYTAGLYGHSNPVIRAAITEALNGGLVLGGPNPYERKLAELMCARFPSLERVRFCNSGTEANLMALSLARACSGRSHVMVFEGAYHGGVFYYGHGGSPINAPFPTVMGDYNDAAKARDLIEAHKDDLAAILVEPMMGAGGGIPGSPEFLSVLRQAADEHGITLIFDEVMTSRLAPGGLQEKLGITPDLTSFGKYLGGGVTFGAFGGRAALMERFNPARSDAFPHSGTYNNNVLTMAAGCAGLGEVFTPEAAVALNASGDRLRDRLNGAARARGAAAEVTGVGSILCVHFGKPSVTRPGGAETASPEAQKLFHLEMNLAGFYLARRGFMSLSLPMEPADHDAFVAAFETFLEDYVEILDA